MLRQGYQRNSVAAASQYTQYIIWLVIDFELQVNIKSFRIFSHYSLLSVNLVRFFYLLRLSGLQLPHSALLVRRDSYTIRLVPTNKTQAWYVWSWVEQLSHYSCQRHDLSSFRIQKHGIVYFTTTVVANMLRFTVQPFICSVRMDTQKRVSAAL